MNPRFLALPILALIVALAVACGGDDGGITGGGGSGSNWDVSKADDLAHAALIRADELGGTGWSTDEDDFSEDDETMAASCSEWEGFKRDARTSAVVRAKRSLERAGAARDDFGIQVETTVAVYRDNKTAKDLVNRYKAILSNEKFVTCFQDEIKSDVGSGATVTVKRATAATNAPAGGSSAALDVDVRAGRDQLQAQTENYVWLNGNAVIQINLTATKQSHNGDFNKQTVAKQEQAANDARAGKRQRQAAATATPVRGTPTPSATSRAGSPTPAGTTRPGTTATPQRSSSAGPALASLEDTNSHRYVVKMESAGIDFFDMESTIAALHREAATQAPRPGSPMSIEMEGAYVKPDKGRATFTTGSAKITLTTIGTQQWQQVGTKIDGPRSVGRQDPEDLSLAIAMLSSLAGDPAILAFLRCDSNTSNINGGQARRCGFENGQLSRSELQGFVDGFVSDTRPDLKVNGQDVTNASLELWASQPGDYPVRMIFVFEGKDTRGVAFKVRMETNVSDLNRAIEIAAPR